MSLSSIYYDIFRNEWWVPVTHTLAVVCLLMALYMYSGNMKHAGRYIKLSILYVLFAMFHLMLSKGNESFDPYNPDKASLLRNINSDHGMTNQKTFNDMARADQPAGLGNGMPYY